ncbi:hypothetical protein ACJX0J_027292, partial [Zea mays]
KNQLPIIKNRFPLQTEHVFDICLHYYKTCLNFSIIQNPTSEGDARSGMPQAQTMILQAWCMYMLILFLHMYFLSVANAVITAIQDAYNIVIKLSCENNADIAVNYLLMSNAFAAAGAWNELAETQLVVIQFCMFMHANCIHKIALCLLLCYIFLHYFKNSFHSFSDIDID